VSQKSPPFYFSNNSVKNKQILMIFAVLHPEKIWLFSLYICPPYLYTVATLPWEIQKSHFQQNTAENDFSAYLFTASYYSSLLLIDMVRKSLLNHKMELIIAEMLLMLRSMTCVWQSDWWTISIWYWSTCYTIVFRWNTF